MMANRFSRNGSAVRGLVVLLGLLLVLIVVVINTYTKDRPVHTQTVREKLYELENSPRGQQLREEAAAEYQEEKEAAALQAQVNAKIDAALEVARQPGRPSALPPSVLDGR